MMLTTIFRRLLACSRANSAVEFAFTAPIVIVLGIGAFDYGRAYVEKVRMTGAARAGAQLALYQANSWDATASMERSALEEYAGGALTDSEAAALPVAASATNFCACTSGPTMACGGTCADGATPGRFVRVTVTGATSLTFPYPWASGGTTDVRGEALVRVR